MRAFEDFLLPHGDCAWLRRRICKGVVLAPWETQRATLVE
jgi:hypothetical protein